MRWLPWLPLSVVLAAAPAGARQAPLVHPIYASIEDAPHDDQARGAFAQAVARYRAGPVETIDVPGPDKPRAPQLLREGTAALDARRHDEAQAALDAAVAEVERSGGAGLSGAELADLFLRQAMAAQRADWKDLPGPLQEITPPAARQAYLRAATLAPGRVLAPRQYPPVAVASWQLALAEIKRRPRGNIVVRAPAGAQVTIDGGAPLLPPATALDLVHGDHFVRVEEIGHHPWSAIVTLAEPSLEIDRPPVAPLSLDPKRAAEHARRMGARFALLAQLRTNPLQIELALLDAASGVASDSTTVPFGGDRAPLEAAVMRLDEEARRRALLDGGGGPLPIAAPALRPLPPRDSEPPAPFVVRRWPLLTAVAVAVGAAVAFGAVVARDDREFINPR